MNRYQVKIEGRTILVTDNARGGVLSIHWPTAVSYAIDTEQDPMVDCANDLTEQLESQKLMLTILGENTITMALPVPVYLRLAGSIELCECDLVNPILHNVDLSNVRSLGRLVANYSRLTDIKVTSARFDYCHMGSQKFTKAVQYNHNSVVEEVQL